MNSLPQGAFSMQEKRPHGYQKFALQQFTPEQMKLFSQLFGHLGPDSFLNRLAGGEEGLFEEMEAPALRQFGDIQSGIASKFSGMGMGGRQSSGFQNASTSAAQDFAGQLQSNRQNLQRQAIKDLMGISDQLLGQRPFDQGYQEKKKKGGWGEFVGTLFGGAPGAATGDFSGAMQGMKNVANAIGYL